MATKKKVKDWGRGRATPQAADTNENPADYDPPGGSGTLGEPEPVNQWFENDDGDDGNWYATYQVEFVNGKASLPLEIYDDDEDDGNDTIPLSIEPGADFGFSQETYIFSENVANNLDDSSVEIELSNDSEFKTAIIIIEDTDPPNSTPLPDFTNKKDTRNGTDGNDIIYAKAGDDSVSGLNGNDSLYGEAGVDTLKGGLGKDELFGGSGDDKLYGNENDDYLDGLEGNDTLDGGGGADTLKGWFGNDTLIGGSENDYLYGEAGTDTLDGGKGFDFANYSYATAGVTVNLATGKASGGDGKDVLLNIEGVSGSSFKDTLIGGNGDNTLIGGPGKDQLTGNNGADKFTLNSTDFTDYYGDYGVDTITDFNQSEGDKIVVSESDFQAGFAIGDLPPEQFTIGSAATNANHRFIYNASSGGLFFDYDGSGEQYQIASLTPGLSLTSSAISVIA